MYEYHMRFMTISADRHLFNNQDRNKRTNGGSIPKCFKHLSCPVH